MSTTLTAMSRVDKFSKSDIIVSPSNLSANFAKLGEQVKAVELARCDRVHVDVMDGHFVPNITIGPLVHKDIMIYVRNSLLGAPHDRGAGLLPHLGPYP